MDASAIPQEMRESQTELDTEGHWNWGIRSIPPLQNLQFFLSTSLHLYISISISLYIYHYVYIYHYIYIIIYIYYIYTYLCIAHKEGLSIASRCATSRAPSPRGYTVLIHGCAERGELQEAEKWMQDPAGDGCEILHQAG